MSYSTIEAAIVSVLQQHADLDSTNTKRADRRPMAKGKARVVEVTYGGHRQVEISLGFEQNTWVTFINVFVPWRGEMNEWLSRMSTEVQKVIDIMRRYPKLNGTANVLESRLVNAQIPERPMLQSGGYRGQRLICETIEWVSPGRLE